MKLKDMLTQIFENEQEHISQFIELDGSTILMNYFAKERILLESEMQVHPEWDASQVLQEILEIETLYNPQQLIQYLAKASPNSAHSPIKELKIDLTYDGIATIIRAPHMDIDGPVICLYDDESTITLADPKSFVDFSRVYVGQLPLYSETIDLHKFDIAVPHDVFYKQD